MRSSLSLAFLTWTTSPTSFIHILNVYAFINTALKAFGVSCLIRKSALLYLMATKHSSIELFRSDLLYACFIFRCAFACWRLSPNFSLPALRYFRYLRNTFLHRAPFLVPQYTWRANKYTSHVGQYDVPSFPGTETYRFLNIAGCIFPNPSIINRRSRSTTSGFLELNFPVGVCISPHFFAIHRVWSNHTVACSTEISPRSFSRQRIYSARRATWDPIMLTKTLTSGLLW